MHIATCKFLVKKKTVADPLNGLIFYIVLRSALPIHILCSILSAFCISSLLGNKLTSDDLVCVLEEVLDVSANWYDLGLQLKVRTAELDSIRAQTSTPKIQLREMLNIWLRTGDDPSWVTLTDALRSRSVGANRLAGTLKQKCCLVEETEVNRCMSAPGCLPATPPPVSESVVPTLQPQVAEMQGSE